MMRWLTVCVALLLSGYHAAAQGLLLSGLTQNYSGTTAALPTTGADFTSSASALFALTSATMNFNGAVSIAFGLKISGSITSGNLPFLSNRTTSSTGVAALYYTSFTNVQNITGILSPTVGGTCGQSMLCVRTSLVSDGSWHHY